MNIRMIFEKGNVGLGWATLWRLALILVPLNLLSELVALEASTNPAGAVAMLFALPVGGNVYLVPIAIPILLFAWNWVGKYVMETKLGVRPSGFVGWSLYWRVLLLQLAGYFAVGLVFVPLTMVAMSTGDTARVLILSIGGLILLPALVYWSLNVVGFVIRRVAGAVPVSDGAESALPGSGPLMARSYQSLFDPSRHDTNWMLAAAYVATGLAASLTYPAVSALFGEGFNFRWGPELLAYFISWCLAGTGLVLVLHRFRQEWMVIVSFAALLVALRFFEVALSELMGEGEYERLTDPVGLGFRASFALLFISGILAGIRFIGPTIAGFAIGIGIAQLIHIMLVVQPSIALMNETPIAFIWSPLRFAQDLVSVAVDATISGLAFWWACDWHLGRRGLRLTHHGAIEPRASTTTDSTVRTPV